MPALDFAARMAFRSRADSPSKNRDFWPAGWAAKSKAGIALTPWNKFKSRRSRRIQCLEGLSRDLADELRLGDRSSCYKYRIHFSLHIGRNTSLRHAPTGKTNSCVPSSTPSNSRPALAIGSLVIEARVGVPRGVRKARPRLCYSRVNALRSGRRDCSGQAIMQTYAERLVRCKHHMGAGNIEQAVVFRLNGVRLNIVTHGRVLVVGMADR